MSAPPYDRLRAFFLDASPAHAPRAEPAALADARPGARRTTGARTAPATLGVLAGVSDAPAAGAALALTAAALRGAPCALVCRWTGAVPVAPPSGTAPPSARRLAQRLAARGQARGARGRLVTVALPAAAREARAAAQRAIAAAGDSPVAVVVGGPRAAAFDPLLSDLERLIVVPAADAPAGLEELAVAAALHLNPATHVFRAPTATTLAGRVAADLGLLIAPSLRAAARAALNDDHDRRG